LRAFSSCCVPSGRRHGAPALVALATPGILFSARLVLVAQPGDDEMRTLAHSLLEASPPAHCTCLLALLLCAWLA